MISSEEMALIEKASSLLGVDTFQLMENAGKAVKEALEKDFKLKGKKIIVVCGLGNNGGDGLVALRLLLKEGYNAKAVMIAGALKSKEAAAAYEKIVKKFPYCADGKLNEIKKADLVIDAIFGTGFRGVVEGDYRKAITEINKSKAIKVSIDVPSGFDLGQGRGKGYVNADRIYCLHAVKKGLEKFAKKTKILDIGIPKEAENIVTPKQLKDCLKERSAFSHKGQNGVVAIVAGSSNYPGAAMLCSYAAKAALRAGTDLVYAACPEKVAWLVNIKMPDAISVKLKGNYLKIAHMQEIEAIIKRADTVLIGPGLGSEKETASLVRAVVNKTKKRVVLDADAIKAVRGMRFKGNVLLTPHAREFEICFGRRLTGNYLKKADAVKGTAKKHNCTILLKGPLDIISDGKKVVFNATGNAAMTVGGTGDVLAGLCCAFAAKMPLYEAACCAAFINGWCGDRLFKEKAYGLIASDIIEEIPKAMKELKG